jgi:two-component system, response regulator PdtaR
VNDDVATILVVDDDRLVLATVVAGLRQAGFAVLEADNGDDAILIARRQRPRLAILDMRMEGKSGIEVARYLAANTRTGFMFVSAFGDREIVEEANRLGALGYLVKPIDIRQIVPAVNAALARIADSDREAQAFAESAPESGAGGRAESIAIGILMERLRIDEARAVDALRTQARAEGSTVAALAASMVEAANRLNSISR